MKPYICPNCLTNEWNDNEDQICIYCKLNFSHIRFDRDPLSFGEYKTTFPAKYRNPKIRNAWVQLECPWLVTCIWTDGNSSLWTTCLVWQTIAYDASLISYVNSKSNLKQSIKAWEQEYGTGWSLEDLCGKSF